MGCVEVGATGRHSAPATRRRLPGPARGQAIGKDSITLSHGPIPSLKWGEMTMDFKLPASSQPRNLVPGDKVSFEFYMDAEGLPQLTRVSAMAPEPKAATAKPAGSKP